MCGVVQDLKEQDGDVVPASRKEGGKAKASAAKSVPAASHHSPLYDMKQRG